MNVFREQASSSVAQVRARASCTALGATSRRWARPLTGDIGSSCIPQPMMPFCIPPLVRSPFPRPAAVLLRGCHGYPSNQVDSRLLDRRQNSGWPVGNLSQEAAVGGAVLVDPRTLRVAGASGGSGGVL